MTNTIDFGIFLEHAPLPGSLHKRLGVPYGSFLLDDASVVDEQTLLLKYFENDYWTLTVRKQRPLRLFTSYLSLKRRR